MLLSLSLQDFVIVDQLNLDFQPGFTVLTGETGAGKSITLDAIGLLLGDKADYSQIRSGTAEAKLSALFDIGKLPQLQSELREQGLLDEDSEELSIRRIIDTKGKSRAFVNNQNVTLSQLKQIGSRLIDIHGQNAHHSLNQESAQRELLDAFAGNQALLSANRQHYQAWQQAERALEEARTQRESRQIEYERLEWQYQELSRLQPVDGEWESLNQSHDVLAHAAELLQAAHQSDELINGDNGIQSLIYRCQKLLEPLSGIEPCFSEALDRLAAAEAELGEAADNLHTVAGRIEINPSELAAQEERMAELMGMARKYRIEPEELPARLRDIGTALQNLEAAADTETLAAAAEQHKASYLQTAEQLSAARREAAVRLSAETAGRMQELSMKGAQFDIELLPAPPASHGCDHVRYLVAANQGTPLRPLNKVASGGELARISLALQVVTSRYTQVPTLIFDEVDTGIGGSVAETVGKALRSLGIQHQVLAVTHLPQVAACGEQHWQVCKHHKDGQTVSSINILDKQNRIGEIARMLGGEKITETTLQHAAEMLSSQIHS
ncbi:MAG: DNA repair protein RecN [Neisseria sp.]|nr:DNA repair protein RecN [Neisseria sp.]